ncbi:MAG: dockerin type I domain-containing protein, partial [candidate division Zixibacteria bacterium]|nr:dockerin type I domain-containing protein [candidate division Zixibacteria bacterium]
YGTRGISPQARVGLVSVGNMTTAEAVLTALDSLIPGDVMLIELNAPGPRYDFQGRADQSGYVCMEYFPAEFDAIQMAWAKGIIVCEAAGNGAEYLSDPIYENRFDTTYRNSHAILIGAGAPPSGNYGVDRSRLSFPNFGHRVNLQGHGVEVVTTGYGDLFNGGGDEKQYYTAEFSGTSSAVPVVAGAVASLQGIFKAQYDGAVLDADRMRDILIATGSPQQGSVSMHIGPRPDLRAADSALPPPTDLTVSPIYIDTTIAVGTQMIVPLTLTNGSSTTTLQYDITTVDSMLKNPGDWLVVPDPIGLIPPSSYVSVNLLLDATVIEDRMLIYKGQVQVTYGEEGGPLDQQSLVPVFLSVPCADTTYAIKASFQPEGRPFQWVDITSTGTIIPSYSWYNPAVSQYIIDDGTAGPINIGFDFTYFDSVYTKFFIGANGAISFTDTNINVQGFYTNTVTIPGQPFATFVAPFWNDLNLDAADGGHGAVYIFRAPHKDTLVVEYYRAGNFISADDTLTTFEVILSRDGDITFQYLSVGNAGWADSALIGAAAAECRADRFFAYGQPSGNRVDDSTAVHFERMVAVWNQAGDVNNDGKINVADAVYIISYIFRSGPAPVFSPEGDVNCDGKTNIGDAIYIISYVFRGGPAPCIYQM